MTVVLECVYGLAMVIFTIAFIVEWIRTRNEINQYLKYGVWFGVIVVGLDLLIVATIPTIWDASLVTSIVLEPLVLIRMIGFAMLGMYYAAISGYPSFPILLRKFNPIESITRVEGATRSVPDLFIEINWKDYFVKVLGLSVICIAYSSMLFLLTTPRMTETVQQGFGTPALETEGTFAFQWILLLVEIAIAEEIVFRLGIQSFLVKQLKLQESNYWIAILMTATLWTLGHIGILEPEWVKLVQIFPIGIMLGWLYKKYGAESTMLVHDLLFRPIYIFVIMELHTCRTASPVSSGIVHAGVTRNPTDQWVAQQLREATPWDEKPKYLIRDRDSKFGQHFAAAASGIEILKIPPRSPRANSFCERFIGSLRRECRDHMLILHLKQLRRIVQEYIAYFNTARPHQGLEQRIPDGVTNGNPWPVCQPETSGKLISAPVLGGLHHHYSWATTS